MLVIPALMIALSTILPLKKCRILNIVFGILYTFIMLAVIPGTWLYYRMFALIEIGISASITWLAYKWPQQNTAKPPKAA